MIKSEIAKKVWSEIVKEKPYLLDEDDDRVFEIISDAYSKGYEAAIKVYVSTYE